MNPFQPLRIISVDYASTRESPKGDSRFMVYFELSGVPSREWASLMIEEWHQSREPIWHEIRIEGRRIIADCSLGKIETEHLDYLSKVINRTNRQHAFVQSCSAVGGFTAEA
jgi:hypothetical protein